jgi:carbohydrate-selective porin OprB
MAPVVQYLVNPAGLSGAHDVVALALRSQTGF